MIIFISIKICSEFIIVSILFFLLEKYSKFCFFLCLRSKNKKKWKKKQIWWEAKICVQEYSCQYVCMCLEFDFELKYHQYVTWKWFAICIKRKILHLWLFIGYTIYTMQRKNKYFKMTNLRIISLLKKNFIDFFTLYCYLSFQI